MYSWLLDTSFVKAWMIFLILFYIASLLGASVYLLLPEDLRVKAENWVREYYESRIPSVGLNPVTLFLIILVNNSVVVILTWLLSITIVFPIVVIAVNGLILGLVVPFTIRASESLGSNVDYITLFLTLAPHGVIEVPAIALVSSAFIIAFTRGFREFLSSMPGVLIVALTMIIVAAAVESTISLLLGLIAQVVAILLP